VLLVLVGEMLLVWWGFFGDRGKDRPRCSKCWYDMRGHVPGAAGDGGDAHPVDDSAQPLLVCPECGHDAQTLRGLYRNRKKPWAIQLGIVALALTIPFFIPWLREQPTIWAIRRAGGIVETNTGGRLPGSWFPGPKRAIRVKLASPPATRSGWGAVAKLSRLRYLDLEGSSITDSGLYELRHALRDVRALNLSRTSVTNDGLTYLGYACELQHLDLSNTQVTSQGCQKLKHLTRLSSLSLQGTQIADGDLVHLQDLSELEDLDLAYTKITDAGIAQFDLKKLPHLSELNIAGTDVTREAAAKFDPDSRFWCGSH